MNFTINGMCGRITYGQKRTRNRQKEETGGYSMKTVLAQLKQYKKDSLLTMGFTMLEVIMEVLLPFITALIIDNGLEQSNMSAIIKYGILMIAKPSFFFI